MERHKLGSDGPEISVVGFGAWEAGGDLWGPNESDQRVIDAIRAALGAGMTWIDTADVYGDGRSEELVGKAISGRRDDVLLFTKVAPREHGGGGSGFYPDEVRRAIRGSLDRLATDRIDLYQLHWPTAEIPVEETWGAMSDLQDEGMARWIGVANFDRALVERCEPIRHVDSVQNQFSLVSRGDREELIPWLAAHGIGYLAYGSLGFGILTGSITKDTQFRPEDWRSGRWPGMGNYEKLFAPSVRQRWLDRVDRMRPIAERLGASMPAVAVRWVIAQPGVSAAIAGSRDPDHVRVNAEAGELTITEDDIRNLDEIFAS